MYIILGLGNPGIEYETTRHNAGWMVAERLADIHDIALDKKTKLARWGKGTIAGEPVIIAIPLTYMNNSGLAAKELIRSAEVGLDHLIVVYDDLDLEPGQIRVRPGGGSGGHNGIRSLINQLGEDTFVRVRIGIGRPPGRQPATDYVLRPFTDREWDEIAVAIERATDVATTIITESVDKAMNEYNRRPL
jgi:PTH1 family peptidyl-tRNA hydrolase